ncbi:CASP-like protein [Artemisia annua]|uniref:CASP-like protein n=1 Tax=Artemisia annua TaxID=35608 RepID=A0A2U1PPZ1_ARTAN|nr:CASP-like protein [Artemisia annua]
METENKNVAVLEGRPIPSPITHLSFMASQIWLRIVAAATSIAAAILIFKSRESKVLFGTDVDARYSYSPAFKFFAMMNVVACGFSVVSLLPVFTLGRKFSSSINYFFLFLHDLLLTTLLAASCGAATTVAQIGKYGNNHAGWMPICDNFGKFCHKVAASLILGYIAIFCYLVLTVISANKARQIPV